MSLGDYWNIWRNAPVATNDFITPEAGDYRVLIESVKYSETDDSGNPTYPTFVYTFRILEGKNQGQRFRRYTNIRDERSASYFKGDLQKLGLPIPANPEELPNVFMGAPGIVEDITVKAKTINGKDYRDIYFNKLVEKRRPQPQQPQAQQPMPPQSFGGQPATAQPPATYQEAPFNGDYYDQQVPF